MKEGRIKEILKMIDFSLKEGRSDFWYKEYENGYIIKIDFKNSKIDYGLKIKIERKTICNFNNEENIVVLECVNRLLNKGYKPESIMLEKSWQLGHKGKGYLDIWVKDLENKSFLMIECKTWGDEYNKEKQKMLKSGGQLFSYLIQEPDTKNICLYSSKFEGDKIIFQNEIVENKKEFKDKNQEETFEIWDKSFETKGIFEDGIKPYKIKFSDLLSSELKDIEVSDGGTIFNQFAEILRRNIISDKTNAFNKIFNLFICKIVDEDEKYETNKELDFQWKKGDDYISFFIRLYRLYKKGILDYVGVKVDDLEDKDLKILQEGGDVDEIQKIIIKLRFYKNNEFAFKEVYNEETFKENAVIVKEIVELLQPYKIKYTHKHQYLGDFFELLLNTGIKQEAGQFFTPIPLAKFICRSLPIKEIIDNKNKAKECNFLPYVIDFASGSGHFLTEIMDEIDNYANKIKLDDIKGGRRAKDEFKSIKDNYKWAKEYVYGIEKDYRLAKTTKVSTFLNGDGDATIISGDGLDNFYYSKKYKGILKKDTKTLENNNFDILVANPPYSVSGFKNTLDKGEETFDLYKQLTDKSSEIECLFIERAKQLLKNGAVAGIILPISLLTNGGIYEKTRELLLKNFKIKSIVSLGSGAFMATGTKTIILFLEKRKEGDWKNIKNIIDNFFVDYQDVVCNNIENIFSTYIKNVYKEIDITDYVSLLKQKPNKKITNSDFYKEYQEGEFDLNKIIKTEKDKILYFALTYNQKVVLGFSGNTGDEEKAFYGYKFSNRRGHEGIQTYKNEQGHIQSKMYDEENLLNIDKLNYYILNNFLEKNNLEKEIEGIIKDDNRSLNKNITILRLGDLIDFDVIKFEKKITLKKKKNTSKYKMVKIGKYFDVFSGNNKYTKTIYKDKGYDVFSASGKDGYADFYEQEGKAIILSSVGSRCGNCFKAEGKWLAIANTVVIKNKENELSLNYIYPIIDNENFWEKEGKGQPFISVGSAKKHKIPYAPKDIQDKIISECDVFYKEKSKYDKKLNELNDEIKEKLNLSKKVSKIKIGEIITLEYGKALPKYNRVYGKYPVMGSNGIDGYHNDYLLEGPSIIVGRKGSAGKVNWIEENSTPIDTTFYVKQKEQALKTDFKYLYFLLRSLKLEDFSGGLGPTGLNRNDVYKIEIFLPDIEEQKKILLKILPIEKEIKKIKSDISGFQEQIDFILYKYLK